MSSPSHGASAARRRPASALPLARLLSSTLALGLVASGLAAGAAPASAAPSAVSAPAAPSADRAPVADPVGEDQQSLQLTGIAADVVAPESAAPAELAVLTEPTETIEFVAAGVTWEAGTADTVTDVSLRVREGDTWTEWDTLDVMAGAEAEDGAELTRSGTEPLLTTGADAVQVSISTVTGEAPEGLKLDLIDPGTATTDAAPQLAATAPEAEQAAPEANTSMSRARAVDQLMKPRMVTRAQWGADESLTQDYASISSLKSIYLHHTAGTNNYTRAQATAQMRSVYLYHTKSLEWPDIAYHFLVDKYGNIYEGKRGASTKLLMGTHAGGFNTDTIAVSALGDYEKVTAPNVMVRAIESVMAWQSARWGMNPLSTATLTSRSSTGTTRFKAGTQVRVPAITGHILTNFTACPGQHLISRFPEIRTNVAAKVNAQKAAIEQRTSGTFADNPKGSRYYDAVLWMKNASITHGYADNTYRKTQAISRGESTAFLYRFANPRNPGTTSGFRDVPATHTFAQAITWASRNGVAQGYSNGMFRPAQNVTRAEFASFMYRAFGPSSYTVRSTFRDVSTGSSHAEAISWMSAQKLITGYADGRFRPQQTISRGEVAVIMYRYAVRIGRA